MNADPPLAAVVWRVLGFAALGALAFPPVSWTWLIWLAPVFWISAVRLTFAAGGGRRHRWALFVGTSAYFFCLLHWLLFLPPEEVTVPGVMVPATGLAALYLGLYHTAAAWVAIRALSLGVPLWLGGAAAWVAAEYLRTSSQLGCPWGLLGYGLTEWPRALQSAEWFGVFGLSFLVAAVAGLFEAAWHRRTWRPAVVGVLVVVAMVLHGQWVIGRGPTPEHIEVALIQGNIGRAIKFKPRYRLPNLERMVALSEAAVGAPITVPTLSTEGPDSVLTTPPEVVGQGKPSLVIWPETAAPCRLQFDHLCRATIEAFADAQGVAVLTGFPAIEAVDRPGSRRWNSAGLIVPGEGLVARYDKTQLVPFGEAIPYQETITWFQRVDFGEADFTRGRGFHALPFAEAPFGVMICYESIFPAAGRQAALAGARWFVNVTNDEWFGRSAGPYQHAAMARLRAVECRRGLARAANTGVSFVVDRFGRVSAPTPLFSQRVVHAQVQLGDRVTPYMRWGDWLPRACVLGCLGVAGWVGVARLRRRRSGG